MKSRLRQNERCPIHRSFTCCGRKASTKDLSKLAATRFPVTRVEDEHHPRGYREICNAQELRRRKHELLSQGQTCMYCSEPWGEYNDVVLAHREPKGMGGARHDDHRSNLGLAHSRCNLQNGSKRIA